MIRIAILAVVAAVALAGTLAFEGRDSAQAGPLPSNIPGDPTCSGTADAYDVLYDVFYVAGIPVSLACFTNGNVICGNDLNLDDAMEILKYDAGLLTQLPSGCPPIGVDAAHGTISSGSATIHGTYAFDIDAGVEGPGSGADFQWSIDAINPLDASLIPYAGAEIAIIYTTFGFEQITYSQIALAAFSDQPIRNTAFFNNLVLAVKTTNGNYAKMKLVDVLYDMPVEWVTYSPPAP